MEKLILTSLFFLLACNFSVAASDGLRDALQALNKEQAHAAVAALENERDRDAEAVPDKLMKPRMSSGVMWKWPNYYIERWANDLIQFDAEREIVEKLVTSYQAKEDVSPADRKMVQGNVAKLMMQTELIKRSAGIVTEIKNSNSICLSPGQLNVAKIASAATERAVIATERMREVVGLPVDDITITRSKRDEAFLKLLHETKISN